MFTPILSGGTTLPSTTVTNYGYLQGNLNSWATTDASIRNIIPYAVTLRSFYANVDTAPGATKAWDFTIVKNGTDTGLTCQIADAATDANNILQPISFAAGDTISIKSVPTNTPTNPVNMRFASIFSAGTSESIILGSTRASNLPTGSTDFHGLQTCAVGDATRGNRDQVIPTAGTLKNLYVEIDGAAGSAKSYTFTLYLNGVAQSLTCAISGTSQTVNSDTTHSVTVAAGDLVSLECVPAGTPTARKARWGLKFEPTIDGEGLILGCSGSSPNTAGSVRYQVANGTSQTWTSTEASTQDLTPVMVLSKFYIDLTVAPGGAASYTFRVRKNSGNGNLVGTITGANTGAKDTNHSDTFAATDKFNISCVSASTPATTVPRWGLVSTIANLKVNSSFFMGI